MVMASVRRIAHVRRLVLEGDRETGKEDTEAEFNRIDTSKAIQAIPFRAASMGPVFFNTADAT